jgi:hypothetical protein
MIGNKLRHYSKVKGQRQYSDKLLGKNLEEARSLFRENFLVYQEDLLFMGPIAFRYYVRAAIDFLLSDEAGHESDAVNTFCFLIEFR